MGRKSKKTTEDLEVETTTESGFSQFDLDERLLKAVGELGWEKPTQVQENLIPLALEGKNILARARTGSGKTAAFLLPVIQNVIQISLNNEEEVGPFAILIAPTKELAGQIFKLLQDLIAPFPFLQAVNFAEMDEDNVKVMLNEVVDMIVSTPGRLLNAVQTKNNILKNIRHVVLDEADLLLSFGYKDEMEGIKAGLPKNYQAIFTSATLNEDMDDIKAMFMTGPVVSLKLKEGQLPNSDQLTQYHINCNSDEERFTIMISLIKLKLIVGKTIIFVSTTDRCYKLHLFLNAFKIRSCVLNAQMPANCRCHVVQEFNEGRYQFIIASDMKDIAPENPDDGEPKKKKKKLKKGKEEVREHDKESGVARGIDFHFVSNVINFDFPKSTDVYIHRVGRTARGFNKGTAISFATPIEKDKADEIHAELEELLGKDTILPYQVRMKDFEGFQLRARDALNACTRSVIRETRLAEIKQEILRSKQLEGYFAKNPRERQVLENDKKAFKMNVHSTAIADVPDYIVPKPLRGQDFSQPIVKRPGFEMAPSNQKRYEKIKHLGEGQFANVYQARDTVTGDIVAIKKIKLAGRSEMEDGIDRSAIREIKLLREIDHDNIITLRDVIGSKKNIQLVMDFMETDLEVVIRDKSVMLSLPRIKNLSLQLLLGLEHLHVNFILHRDLKPNNLLLNSAGRLKITDFGLARFFGSPNREYSHLVVTRWYRSPELLFGARGYGTGVDIWSVGCIMGEMLLRMPVFPGESDIDQLVKIFDVLGVPNEEDWPEMKALPTFMEIRPNQKYNLRNVFSAASDDLLELISSCFEFNPNKRCTTTSALQSAYFKCEPYPCQDSDLPGVTNIEKINIHQNRKRLRDMVDEDGPNPVRRKLAFDNMV